MRNADVKFNGILLDLDGTIVDSREAYIDAGRTAFGSVGQETAMVETRRILEIPRRLEQGLPIDDLIEGRDLKKFLKVYLETYYQSTTVKAKPFPNISNTLRRLSEKAKLAVITMRYIPREKVIEELRRHALEGYFEHIVTALDTRHPKPSPEAIIACARRLGIQTRACLVVGDSIVDVQAGKAVEAKTVAVLSGIFSLEELQAEKPDLILKNVNELPDFVDSLLEHGF